MPDKDPGPYDQYPSRGEIDNFFLGMIIGLAIGLAVGGFIGAVIFHAC